MIPETVLSDGYEPASRIHRDPSEPSFSSGLKVRRTPPVQAPASRGRNFRWAELFAGKKDIPADALTSQIRPKPFAQAPDVNYRWASSRSEISVVEKLSWASKRQTTRPEDTAYSLMV